MTGAGMAGFTNFKRLFNLRANGCPITERRPRNPGGLTRVALLSLDGTKIAGPGLRSLRGMASLQNLSLDRTEVADAALRTSAACAAYRISG